MEVHEVVVDTDLTEFLTRVNRKRESENMLIQWHIDAYKDGGVELPYSVDATYHNVTQYEDYNKETHETPINVEATLDMLAKVMKYARSRKMKVDKNYDSTDFELVVTLDEDTYTRIKYYAPRNTVCTKTVTGTKVIPARVIPEKIEEIVEWECEPISLLAREA